MQSLIHADIFFFVSTIVFIGLAIVAFIALVYVVLILKNVRDISEEVKKETAYISADLKEFRTVLRAEGFKVKHLLDMGASLIKRRKTAKAKVHKPE